MAPLGQAIKAAMGAKERVEDFAARAQLARSTVYDLLSGAITQPELATLRKLRKAGVQIPRDLIAA